MGRRPLLIGAFVRVEKKSCSSGRDKFGPAVAFNIARAKQNGSYAYMDWHNRGLTRERLHGIRMKQSLDEPLRYLVRYFDEAAVLWFDSVN